MSQTKIISNMSNPDKYVGYADLPNQIYRHYSMRGFDFNLMVVGESGLGKSTFVNNLFTTDIYVPAKYDEKPHPISSQTMDIRFSNVTLTENNVSLRLSLIDTPGFGDGIDNSTCWEKILTFINGKHDEYMRWENSSPRPQTKDMRVHCCIYFIAPTGHRLKMIDLDFMKRLHDKVNIIPVIGKSDTLCKEDLIQFKKRVNEDLKMNGIKTYDFPSVSPKDDDDRDSVRSYISRIPFGIVSSNAVAEVDGKPVKCRKYPWGICEIENLQHCDFIALRDLLLRTCICHLIECTHSVIYERYRSQLLSIASGSTSSTGSPLDALENERQKQTSRLEKAKKELEEKYNKKNEEYKAKLSELDKKVSARLASQESAALAKPRGSMDVVANTPHYKIDDNQKTIDVVHTEDSSKKKDKKRKIF